MCRPLPAHLASSEIMKQFSSSKIILLVPKRHIKTVKQALERTGQLDRGSKIAPESWNLGGDRTVGDTIVSRDHHDRPESVPSPISTPVPIAIQTPSSSAQQTRSPRLQLNATVDQQICAEMLQDKDQPGHRIVADQGPRLAVQVSCDSDRQISFPLLQFDVARGEYMEPPHMSPGEGVCERAKQQRMCVPTTIPYSLSMDDSASILDAEELDDLKCKLLQDLALSALSRDISVSHHVPVHTTVPQRVHQNPIHKALAEALTSVLDQMPSPRTLTAETLVSAFPDGYSVYKPMLLLPHNAFSSAPWKSLIAAYPVDSVAMRPVWRTMAEAVGATHVAINSPIPLSTTCIPPLLANTASKENILRSPVNLSPLYGDFGNTPTPQTTSTPTMADFANALWVSTRQNGIWQTWAPLYTMFSRGNIREKTRILNLPSVTTGLDAASAAVDLYAGIGYFAFSYRKSCEGLEKGIKQVLCWELNPWSVEGLRRGAKANGWTCQVLKQEDILRLRRTGQVDSSTLSDADFIVFQTSNEGADVDYSLLPSLRLPVRHVNLGLLPSSKLSWRVALAMLDTKRGGWIHVHENVGVRDVETMQKNVERKFQELIYASDGVLWGEVSVVHVERVKMYAPGVVHCVFDVCVGGYIQV